MVAVEDALEAVVAALAAAVADEAAFVALVAAAFFDAVALSADACADAASVAFDATLDATSFASIAHVLTSVARPGNAPRKVSAAVSKSVLSAVGGLGSAVIICVMVVVISAPYTRLSTVKEQSSFTGPETTMEKSL